MITEEQKGHIVARLSTDVEWRYPLVGAAQFDFDKQPMVYRRGEPVSKEYPLIEMSFLPRSDAPIRGLGDVIKDYSGALVYGYGELEPIIITAYTHQICEGVASAYHGKIIADEYIRRIERYIRRYWPKMLQTMEAIHRSVLIPRVKIIATARCRQAGRTVSSSQVASIARVNM